MRRLLYTSTLTLLFVLSGIPALAEDEHPDDAPSLSSNYVYLVDAGSGQVLWSRNSSGRMYPASMTKLMTEIIAIESLPDLDERVTVTDEMMQGLYEANASMAGFLPGDEPTVRDLLYGTALPSGAECVNALAFRIDGSVENFVSHMNRKAAELGMDSTRFTNPTGLHSDGHYSSAKDIETLFAYCMDSETFRTILGTQKYRSGSVASHPDGIEMESTVWKYLEEEPIPGFLGGKTGFTYPAGRCLASAAEINGMDLYLITGKAPDGYTAAVDDARTVYNWCRDNIWRQTILSEGEQLAYISVRDAKAADHITIRNETLLERDVTSSTAIRIEKDFPDIIDAPVEAGQKLGTVSVYENDVLLYQNDCYADTSIPYSRYAHLRRLVTEAYRSHPRTFMTLCGLIFLLVILLNAMAGAARRKRRRRKKRKSY